jgi:hypothetical protein
MPFYNISRSLLNGDRLAGYYQLPVQVIQDTHRDDVEIVQDTAEPGAEIWQDTAQAGAEASGKRRVRFWMPAGKEAL